MSDGNQTSGQFSTWYYLPIAIVILAGYALGFYGWYRCGINPEVLELNAVELYGSLFSLGMVGGAMHCSRFFGEDVTKSMYGNTGELPNWIDPFGYAFQIIGGGFTGVMFFLVVSLGIGVASGSDTAVEMTPEAGWLMAFAGGFATNRIKEFLVKLVSGRTSGQSGVEHSTKITGGEDNGETPAGKG